MNSVKLSPVWSYMKKAWRTLKPSYFPILLMSIMYFLILSIAQNTPSFAGFIAFNFISMIVLFEISYYACFKIANHNHPKKGLGITLSDIRRIFIISTLYSLVYKSAIELLPNFLGTSNIINSFIALFSLIALFLCAILIIFVWFVLIDDNGVPSFDAISHTFKLAFKFNSSIIQFLIITELLTLIPLITQGFFNPQSILHTIVGLVVCGIILSVTTFAAAYLYMDMRVIHKIDSIPASKKV